MNNQQITWDDSDIMTILTLDNELLDSLSDPWGDENDCDDILSN